MTTEVIVAKRSVLSTVLEYVIDQKIDLIVVVVCGYSLVESPAVISV
jgi:hypothetical protein